MKKKMNPIERAVFLHERGIVALNKEIERVNQAAAEQVAKIKVRIARRKVLADALRSGTLKA